MSDRMSLVTGNFRMRGAQNSKPVVFVFPTFLAVGGVERNTAEVIARLKADYDFVIVTFERLAAAHGSLHHQFHTCAKAVYDLTEIGRHDEIVPYLRRLEALYRPELVWICNGSPWLAANTANIRRIFASAAIVDQQVYYSDQGWVSLYRQRDPGLLSFDRFIAINSRIRSLFIDQLGMDAGRIDLIYSVISTEKRAQALAIEPETLRAKFGLEPGKRYLASIGRLTAQKAPLDFVGMIEHVVRNGPSDVDFLVVGSGELDGSVDEALANRGLNGRVRRIDYVQNSFELSRVIDAIVFTSHYEGLPIALLEALSLGTPGLCTDTGDIGLVFREYGSGLTFEKIGDPVSLARGITSFLADYPVYKAAAVEHADTVARRFSMDAIQNQYRACFDAALDSLNHTATGQ